MIKRWLFRSFFIGLLVLCVGAWVISRWWTSEFTYLGTSYDGATLADGRIGFGQNHSPSTFRTGWHQDFRPNVRGYWSVSDLSPNLHGLGFSCYHDSGRWDIIIPLWLPTLLLAGLNWFVWRKTKPKPVGRAFPIEPATKPGELKS